MNEETKKKYNRQNRLKKQRLARKKQLLRIRLYLSAIVLLIAILIVLMLRGTFEKKADVSTMTISGKSVTYEEVAPIGDFDYSELKDFAKEETKDVDGIRLVRVAKKGDDAYVKTHYDDIGIYSEFTGYEGFLGTVAEGLRAGYDFDTAFSSVSDGKIDKSVKGKTVAKEKEKNVLIIRENGRFVVDGDVVFVSTENMKVIDKHTVEVTQSEGEEDATVLSYIVYE